MIIHESPHDPILPTAKTTISSTASTTRASVEPSCNTIPLRLRVPSTTSCFMYFLSKPLILKITLRGPLVGFRLKRVSIEFINVSKSGFLRQTTTGTTLLIKAWNFLVNAPARSYTLVFPVKTRNTPLYLVSFTSTASSIS